MCETTPPRHDIVHVRVCSQRCKSHKSSPCSWRVQCCRTRSQPYPDPGTVIPRVQRALVQIEQTLSLTKHQLRSSFETPQKQGHGCQLLGANLPEMLSIASRRRRHLNAGVSLAVVFMASTWFRRRRGCAMTQRSTSSSSAVTHSCARISVV